MKEQNLKSTVMNGVKSGKFGVAAACRRSGRNARRERPGVVRFVSLANLARRSHRPPIVACFSTCGAKECGWLLASATSSEDGDMRDLVLSVVFFSLRGQAIIAAAGRRLWRRRSRAGAWEVRFANFARQSFAHSSYTVLFTRVALTFFAYSCLGECF